MSEYILQSVIMRRALTELGHQIALPNDTSFYSWESDLITVNKSGYVNEFECKISRADFLKDKKKYKFNLFASHDEDEKRHAAAVLDGWKLDFAPRTPNYFWYVTLGFDIEPPDFSGWLKVSYNEKRSVYEVLVMKTAPLRHKVKVPQHLLDKAARLLSFKLMQYYNPYKEAAKEAVVK